MKILVADSFERSGIDALAALGYDVLYQPGLKGDALADALRTSDAAVLVVRSTQVTEPMLDAGHLSLIVRAGAGVNTIDVAAASRRGHLSATWRPRSRLAWRRRRLPRSSTTGWST